MKLSKRLEMVASFVPKGSSVADVGTDHGYVPIYLVSHGIASGAVAMDVRQGPLKRARIHVREAGLENRIEVRLSDGMKGLEPGDADCVVMAGMGGEMMIHIMEEGKRLWKDIGYWVLSPQSEQEKVRRFLLDHSFAIVRDRILKEDGKFYTVMAVTRGNGVKRPGEKAGEAAVVGGCAWRTLHYRYGFLPIRNRDVVLLEFLELEEMVLNRIMRTLERGKTPSAGRRFKELEEKLLHNKEAQDEMQRSD